MKASVIGFIFARGGSKGVPRKNIRHLGGKPLLAWSIECARACPAIQRVVVSTDDQEIAEVALGHGAEVPFMRPAELAADDSPEWLSWQHAVKTLDAQAGGPAMDVFLSIPATSPLRAPEDLQACLDTLLEDAGETPDVVITVKHASRNPYFNQVRFDEKGFARRVIEPEPPIARRQDAPLIYDMTTVAYATRPAFILAADSIFRGRLKAVVVPEERALDIDTELDFALAELLLARRLAGGGGWRP